MKVDSRELFPVVSLFKFLADLVFWIFITFVILWSLVRLIRLSIKVCRNIARSKILLSSILIGVIIASSYYLFHDYYFFKGNLPQLSYEQLITESNRLEDLGQKREFPADFSTFQKTLGLYNGRRVEEVYICFGDICPDYGGYYLRYQDIGAWENLKCRLIGGQPIRGYGWTVVNAGCKVNTE